MYTRNTQLSVLFLLPSLKKSTRIYEDYFLGEGDIYDGSPSIVF